MASRIPRFTWLPFAAGAASTDIEQFGSAQETGIPEYTTDPTVLQALSAFNTGWSAAIVTANHAPYKQDVNCLDFLFSKELCYLAQQGIPEWDAGTTYFNSPNPSVVQYNGGYWYISLQDNNLGNTPPVGASNAFWQFIMLPPTLPTRTVFASGSGTFVLPANPSPQQIYVQIVGGGAGGSGSGSGATAGTGGGNTNFGGLGASGGLPNVNLPGVGSGGDVNLYGGYGTAPLSGNPVASSGGMGGASFFGGGGGSVAGGGGSSGLAPGSGGGGAGSNAGVTAAAGGSAGGYADYLISSPATSYAYTVGAGGAGGNAGGGGYNGGAGAPGIIIIWLYYY